MSPRLLPLTWRLVQGRGFLSGGIGWFGGGDYSHADTWHPVEGVKGGGYWRGARSDMLFGIPAGFYDRPVNYLDGTLKKSTTYTLHVTPEQWKKYWDFSDDQLRKPYDSRGILGFAFGKRDWHDPSEWFCSEEIFANCEEAGIFPSMYEDAWRVDPGDLAFCYCMLNADTKTTVYP